MANAIELAKSYVPLLDEVYAREVLTSDLDGAPELVQQGANANELIIPMMDMQGLADYPDKRNLLFIICPCINLRRFSNTYFPC